MIKITRAILLALLMPLSFPVISQLKESTPGRQTWNLSQFMVRNEPIMLKNISDTYQISFPISDRIDPESVELDLYLSNSNLIHQNRGQVVIFINDYVVGQIKLDPINTETRAQFTISKEYLNNGYNNLSFKVAQHYTDNQCEDWSAPELWTLINNEKSTLTINYRNRPIAESLANLNELLNDRLKDYSLSILRTPGPLSKDYLYWGAILTQGIKLRLSYQPLKLDEKVIESYEWPSTDGQIPGRFNIDPRQLENDAILIGTKDQIENLIPYQITEAITGAYLGLFRQDNNPSKFILIVSGQNKEQVSMASQAFALMNMPFPDQEQTVIESIDIKDAGPKRFRSIVPGSSYKLSQLGFKDKSFDILNSETELQFFIPADMYSTEESLVSLNLNLSYGAALRSDSVINIRLNGLFNHAIQLKEAGGARYENYRINVPLRNFKHGLNRLSFEAVLTPSVYGECSFIQRDNLIASIYQDSTIEFPKAGKVSKLPDLSLLEQTGYPIIQDDSANQTYFKLLDTSSDTISSAWLMIGKLADIINMPLFDINIGSDSEQNHKNTFFIGKLTEKSKSYFDTAPVSLNAKNKFPFRFQEQQSKTELSTSEWLYNVLLSENNSKSAVTIAQNNAVITQTSGLGKEYLFMSYPSKEVDKGLVFALLTEPGNSLNQGTYNLLSSDVWGQLQGNIFIWDDDRKFDWIMDGDSFIDGSKNVSLSYIMHFSEHPWQWILFIVGLILIISWLLHLLLSRFKKDAHSKVEEDAN